MCAKRLFSLKMQEIDRCRKQLVLWKVVIELMIIYYISLYVYQHNYIICRENKSSFNDFFIHRVEIQFFAINFHVAAKWWNVARNEIKVGTERCHVLFRRQWKILRICMPTADQGKWRWRGCKIPPTLDLADLACYRFKPHTIQSQTYSSCYLYSNNKSSPHRL